MCSVAGRPADCDIRATEQGSRRNQCKGSMAGCIGFPSPRHPPRADIRRNFHASHHIGPSPDQIRNAMALAALMP
jgi:hypothetical protein